MSQIYSYFVIPFNDVPQDPNYVVWFATWSTVRPKLEPGMNLPMVVGATTDVILPRGATLLGSGGKDPPPPPPPPAPALVDISEYKKTFEEWLKLGRDA